MSKLAFKEVRTHVQLLVRVFLTPCWEQGILTPPHFDHQSLSAQNKPSVDFSSLSALIPSSPFLHKGVKPANTPESCDLH